MPDKNLTDNEIIKALECHANNTCHNCPLEYIDGTCGTSLCSSALDLINRLQAENERLKENNKTIMQTIADVHTEAIKDFAERLKNEYLDFDEENEVILPENIFKAIDDLLKELVGESGG